MLTVKGLEKSFWSKTLFKGWTFSLWNKVKAWLVWSNWTWKSTLLNILAGGDKDFQWNIQFDVNDPLIGYMCQQISIENTGKPIHEFLRDAVWISQIENEIQLLLPNLEDPGIMDQYSQKYDTFERMWGYSFESNMETTLHQLWLWSYPLETPVSSLSWGEKNKLLLCGTLLRWWDLLLLDEPTNNLDSQSIAWLTDFLRSSIASCLIVSHDRDFLNGIVTKVIEIDDIKHDIVEYTWNYDFYEQQKETEFQNQLLAHQRQQEEFERIEISSRNLKDKASRIMNSGNTRDNGWWDKWSKVAKKLSKTAKAISGRIDRVDKVERPGKKRPLELNLDSANLPMWGIEISGLEFKYKKEDKFTLHIPSLSIGWNDKLLVQWDNWQWKSTFIKLLTWELAPDSWNIRAHPSLNIWYFWQEHGTLDKDLTPITFLESIGLFPSDEINYNLSKMWFDVEDRNKKIDLLSPWMKARLLFTELSMKKSNCIIFDEPTNHVDLETIHQLEHAINGFTWIVVVVSHDKKFIEKVNFTKRLKFSKGFWKEVY